MIARIPLRSIVASALCLLAAACASEVKHPKVGEIYTRTAQTIGDDRNPVIVIPGILGSKLVEPSTGRRVWGAFVHGAVDADYPDDARLFALPMRDGLPLSQLRDEIQPDGVLDTLAIDVGVIPVEVRAYLGIMRTLGAGQYRDAQLARSVDAGNVDYAGKHFTCDQFGYDWRRDISENAAALDALIRRTLAAAQESARTRGVTGPTKVDVIAHSMGGMVLRYYLMHGPNPLPDDGSLPPVTWEGAQLVQKAVIIGTPSAGSVLSLRQLILGVNYSVITPTYRPAILGTMPALYELMTRDRHARVVDASTGAPISDLYDVNTWEKYGWGLLARDQEPWLKILLPDETDRAVRRRIARDQVDKCLRKTRQLHDALDRPAPLPAGLEMHLFAGDAEDTPTVLAVGPARAEIRETAPGDGTVTRASALMDERVGREWTPRLKTPIPWTGVTFLPRDHIGLTSDPTFSDNLLYLLLERPSLGH